MTRALVVLGAVRALVDLADALDELAHRFGVDPLGAHGQLGEWDLDAEINLARFGIGVMWERDGDRDPRTATTTVLTAHLGPVALIAARSRPAAWVLPPATVNCGLGRDAEPDTGYSADELHMHGAADPGPTPSLDELAAMDAHAAEQSRWNRATP